MRAEREETSVRRAYTVESIMALRREAAEFEGQWLEAFGKPELKGTWCIGGLPKNGKTSFCMMLAKYLTQFHSVAYNSIEEGISGTFAEALRRAKMEEIRRGRFMILNGEEFAELERRLAQRKSPKVIIVDSIQFLGLNQATYLRMKKRFPDKLFIYITHLAGQYPEGKTAIKIWRDSSVVVRVEGFKAYPTSRYGGGKPIVISEERAKMFEI